MTSIFQILRERNATRDGKIVMWGSFIQFPAAFFQLWQSWVHFPEAGTEQLLFSGLFHLATPVALVGTFIRRGGQLGFRNSFPLTVLLLLIAVAPFLLSTGIVK